MTKLTIPISGTFELSIRNIDTGKVRKVPEFKNLIVDAGFDRLLSTLPFMDYCFCGTGSTPPVVSNTTMQAYLAETNDIVSDQSESTFTAPRYMVQKRIFTFAVGAVVGNVAELGIGWKVSTTRLVFSRTLVTDSGGTPTTITILANEQLTVTYRLYVKVPDADQTFSVTDGATTYNVSARLAFDPSDSWFRNFPSGFYGASNSSYTYADTKETDVLPPIGTNWVVGISSQRSATYSIPAYVTGSFVGKLTASFATGNANYATGIGSVMFGTREGSGAWMMSFSPKIPKIAGKTLTLTFEYQLTRGTPP
jgi:hypothetical protein